MKKDDFEIIIGSPFDREKLICEIHYKGEIIAEISQDKKELLLEIYSPRKGEWWEVPFLEFQRILEDAKNHLIYGTDKTQGEKGKG